MSLKERVKYAEMKKRHEKKIRPWYKKPWGIIIIILIGLLLSFSLAAIFYIVETTIKIQNNTFTKNTASQERLFKATISGYNNYYLGNNSAKIVIVEFSDFACPFCQKTAPILKNIFNKYQNDIKIIYRDYPTHETSTDLALAARCAGEQNNFWLMHDLLFKNSNQFTNTKENLNTKLISLAQELGLDSSQFSECLSSRRYINDIKKDYDDANTLNIKGTPTWFVNNYPITGFITENKFEELINTLLQ